MRLIYPIILVGLILRITWIATCDYKPPMTFEQARTEGYTLTEYDIINIDAVRISRGIWPSRESGEPLAWRPIGYPAFLGLCYLIFGVSYWTLWTSTIILHVITTLLIYAIGREVFDKRTGLVSALLFSIFPNAIFSTSMSVDEHLFLPLFFGGILLLIRRTR